MITKPKVYIIAHTPNPEKVISVGAKLCYSPSNIENIEEGLDEKETKKFVKMLSNMGHESPLEHASFTFGIENVSRVLTHQLVRHRIASFSQKSQRYVKEGQFEYVIPEAFRDNLAMRSLYQTHMEKTQEIYDSLVDEVIYQKIEENYTYAEIMKEGREKLGKQYEKYAIENARYVLPNATETKIVMTMNSRSLINFFKLRTCYRSQTEIRDLADAMYIAVMGIAPSIFKDQVAGCISDNKCPEGKMSCGVKRTDLKEMFADE